LDNEDRKAMNRIEAQRGFTLAELAITIVVLGILVGGALTLGSIVDNARVSATVAQITDYSNAVAQFETLYVSPPGDLTNAGWRMPNCPGVNGAACNPLGPSDGVVGNAAWDATWGAPASATTGGLTGGVDVDSERYLFWAQLLNAGLIGNVRGDGLYGAIPFQIGVTNPGVSTGGGLIVGYDSATGVAGPGATAGIVGPGGLVVVQVVDPKVALQTTAGQLPLSPQRAAQIDRKVDDGAPGSGYVQAYGVTASCYCTTAACGGSATAPVYNQKVAGKDCGLIYRLAN
jgi:prepilin-type N-terminal cleavage/methylation domain-containing protein